MAPTLCAIDLVSIITFTLIIVLALIYSIPIICIRRFHHNNNMLTVNICFATICCGLSWFSFYAAAILIGRDGNNSLFFIFNMITIAFTIQVPFSFMAASIHRCCSIIYHANAFFKTRQWIALCIGSQWLLCLVLSLPNYISINTFCDRFVWLRIHNLITIVIIPAILSLLINILIYNYVRASSNRIQPQMIPENAQRTKFSHRDMKLVRHMIFMFCIFVGGWTPIYIMAIINFYSVINTIISSSLTILCELASFINIIDLFLYNRQLRKYFKRSCVKFAS
ncbi:unnamed protein product [Rotaria magnacalcarata]|uniref:G-protein coupled receptors family 1 profile domain-containing protein n=1 Tax=Rotaria magnacalcarata TaxID=392030 RepID=A0A816MS10_9BILA|nr:unnamed protein product [Rotaria magnacalcarata]